MKREYSKIVEIVAILMTLLGLSTISYSADKIVAFLQLGDYTGPSALTSTMQADGAEDYFKYVNEQGGINGVKINYIKTDTRYEVSRAASSYKRYRMTPKLLAVCFQGTPLGKAVSPLTNRDGVVALAVADGEFIAKPTRIFTWGQTYQDTFGAALDWIVKDWKQKGKSGLPTLGYISWDADYGREALKGGREYLEKLPIKFLDPVFFPVGVAEHDIYLARLKGANYIYGGGPEPQSPAMIRDAYRMGMTKETQFICDWVGPMQNAGVKAYNEQLQGTIVASWVARGDDYLNHPLVKKMWTTYRKPSMDEVLPSYAVGLGHALNFVAALKIALEKVGYERLDKDDMYEAYQKLTGMDTYQGLQGPCAYSPTERRGSKDVKFYRVEGMKLIPITRWVEAPDTVSLYRGKW